MIKKFILTTILLVLFANVFAQKSNLTGNISDGKTKEPIIGATVLITNTTIGASSDINGNFTIPNLNVGVYDIQVSYVSYDTKITKGVKIIEGQSTALNVLLNESTVSLEGVTIVAVKRDNNQVFTINNIKNSSVVVNGVSAQLINQTQDKDASEIVKRLPGISVVDDKFIIIRGLSSRYNSVWLNNSSVPSLEADSRSFSFDLIPSSIIENILIYKSPMAELPSDYSGGFVKIETVGIPAKDEVIVSYGVGVREQTLFNDFYKEQATNADLLTLGIPYRSLPTDMPNHLNEYELATNPDIQNRITDIGRELNNSWLPIESHAIPDNKFSLTINRKYEKGSLVMGNTTSIMYSYLNNTDNFTNNSFSIYDFANDKPSYIDEFNDTQYKTNTRLGLLHNWTVYPNDKLKFEFKNFVSNTGESLVTLRDGKEWYVDGREIKSTEVKYTNRLIYLGQLNAEYELSDNTVLSATGGYSLSKKNNPDIRRYKYIKSDDYFLTFGSSPDLASLSRMWLDLNEDMWTGAVNLTHKLKETSDLKIELKSGVFTEIKNRDFDARNFGYSVSSDSSNFRITYQPINEIFEPENINMTDGIKLREITSLSDSYTAKSTIFSAYSNFRASYKDKIDLSAGVRLEKGLQELHSYRQGTTTPVNTSIDTINLFPSANIAFNINKKSLVRAVYGKSVNRPEFRETASFYFVDFDQNAGIYGNPNIGNSYIHNFDLRYELYPSSSELFNVGVFYKRFIDPIEVVILGNNPTQFSFDNVDFAYSYGLETELHKSFDFISPKLKNFSAILNLSLIKSSVIFDRPLQGQSPYIINLGLYYNNPKNKIIANVVYNRIGKRMIAVGRTSPNEWESIPDIYEMPRNEININLGKSFGKFDIKFMLKDLLGENINYEQNTNTWVNMEVYGQQGMKYFDRNQTVKSIYAERQYIINLSYKF